MSEVQATHGQSVIITRLSFITAFSWRWSEYLTIDTLTVRTDLASAEPKMQTFSMLISAGVDFDFQ